MDDDRRFGPISWMYSIAAAVCLSLGVPTFIGALVADHRLDASAALFVFIGLQCLILGIGRVARSGAGNAFVQLMPFIPIAGGLFLLVFRGDWIPSVVAVVIGALLVGARISRRRRQLSPVDPATNSR